MTNRIVAANLRLKRAYEPPGADDGLRILVDRLRPRSVSKTHAGLDGWGKEVASSWALRKWFGRDPARWQEFRQRYASEQRQNPEPVRRLRALARARAVTLVYAAHDQDHNDAVVLRDIMLGRSPR
jgi:uncharacterized protein YeaO (DUF488 family)